MDNAEKARIKVLKEISKKIKRKNIIVGVISALSACIFFIGFYFLNAPIAKPVEYERSKFKLSLGTAHNAENGKNEEVLNIDYYGVPGTISSIALKDENNEGVLYLQVKENVNRIINMQNKITLVYNASIENVNIYTPEGLGEAVMINKVYYLIYDLPINLTEFNKIKDNAILIWER